MQRYHTIFPVDIDLRLRDESLDAMALPLPGAANNGSPVAAPLRRKSVGQQQQQQQQQIRQSREGSVVMRLKAVKMS